MRLFNNIIYVAKVVKWKSPIDLQYIALIAISGIRQFNNDSLYGFLK